MEARGDRAVLVDDEARAQPFRRSRMVDTVINTTPSPTLAINSSRGRDSRSPEAVEGAAFLVAVFFGARGRLASLRREDDDGRLAATGSF